MMEGRQKKLPPLEGILKKLDTTLGMRKWVKYYSRFEDEKLCFFDSPSEDSCSAFVDLGMVTSIKQQHAMSVLDNRPNPPEEEVWQIQIMTPEDTTYLCLPEEDSFHRWMIAIKMRVDYYMADQPPVPDDEVSSTPDKSLFSISNSEMQNQGNLKGYYSMLKARTGSPPPTGLAMSPPSGGIAAFVNGGENAVAGPLAGSLQESASVWQDRLAQTERKLKTREAELEAIKQQLAEKEAEFRKKEAELNSSFESKKKSLSFIVTSKDQEIEKLRREGAAASSQKVHVLSEALAAKEKELAEYKATTDKEFLELKQKLSDRELEVLELREKEMSMKAKQNSIQQEAVMAAIKKQRETEEIMNRVKDRYFFSLALNVKLTTGNGSLDLNTLYERAKRDQIPFDKWQEWLMEKFQQNPAGAGPEEEDDLRGF